MPKLQDMSYVVSFIFYIIVEVINLWISLSPEGQGCVQEVTVISFLSSTLNRIDIKMLEKLNQRIIVDMYLSCKEKLGTEHTFSQVLNFII